MKWILTAALATLLSACVLVAEGPSGGPDEVTVCHKGKKTMTLPRSAASAHMDHGDRYGPC
jgi:hypothetical protein